MPLLVLGLGNPGPRFDGTRHNVGFAVAEGLAACLGFALRNPLFAKYRLGGPATVGDSAVFVAEPLTYMNRSGEVVPRLLRRTRTELDELLVVVDTLDLPVGAIRLKRKGSDGGHRGLQSITGRLGTGDYSRLYLGIGRPRDRSRVVEYVISRPPSDEPYQEMYDRAVGVVLSVAEHGVERVMNEVNRRTTS